MSKKLIAPVVVSGALLGSLVVGGAAYAAAPTPTATGPAAAHAAAHHADGKARAWWKAHRRSIRAQGWPSAPRPSASPPRRSSPS